MQVKTAYSKVPMTQFESALADRLRGSPTDTTIFQGETREADGARAFVVGTKNGLIVDCDAVRAKYGVGIGKIGSPGMSGDLLIKNFSFNDHQGATVHGAGIINDGPQTNYPNNPGRLYVSNAWIDLGADITPDPTYKLRNMDGATLNGLLSAANFRECMMANVGDGCVDSKGPVDIDYSVFMGGHRVLRQHDPKFKYVATNSIFLLHPQSSLIWWGGDDIQDAVFEYWNCWFGKVGDDVSQLKRDPLPEWVQAAPGKVVALKSDPRDRSASSFWQPGALTIPNGWVKGDLSKLGGTVTPTPVTPQPTPTPTPTTPPPTGTPVLMDPDWVAFKAMIRKIASTTD